MMEATLSPAATPGRRLRRLLWAAPAAGLVSALLNAGLYYGATAAGWLAPNLLTPSGDRITVVPVMLASLLPALAAGILLALLLRFTRRPVTIFRVVGVVFLLVSLMGPLNTPGIDAHSAQVLNLMHLVAAGAILYLLPRWSRA